MKLTINALFVLAIALLTSCSSNSMKVDGTLIGGDLDKLTLEIIDGAKRTVIDESPVVDGKYAFDVKLKSKTILGIYAEGDLSPLAKLIGKEGDVKVVIDYQKKKEEYDLARLMYQRQREYRKRQAENYAQIEEVKAAYRVKTRMAKSIQEKKKIEKERSEEIGELQRQGVQITVDMIRQNTDNIWGLRKLSSITGSISQKDNLELLELFRAKYYQDQEFKMMDRYAKMEIMRINEKAIDFTIKDINGKDITLSDYKGKVVLIDFWASWCKPCRATNPEVVKLYNKYHKKGLEIIGISLDSNEAAWKKAIKDDQLPWMQASNLDGFECEVGFKYGVRAIPHIFVIDKDGVFKGEKLHGPALVDLIEELL